MLRPRNPVARVVRALALLLLVVAAACAERPARTELVVSAAASLSDVMRDAAAEYGRLDPGVVVRVNTGASGALEQQIRQGAGVDVFAPASEREMEALARDGLVLEGTRRTLAGNALVLVVPARGGAPVRDFRDLAAPAVKRVAMGLPASVPAGRYALASLRALGLWGAVEPKVVYTANVRQALAYAEQGDVDAALVYRTDAMRSKGVRVVATAPPGTHPPIVYPVAVVAASARPEEARRLVDFLAGPGAAAILRRYGFVAGAPGDSARLP